MWTAKREKFLDLTVSIIVITRNVMTTMNSTVNAGLQNTIANQLRIYEKIRFITESKLICQFEPVLAFKFSSMENIFIRSLPSSSSATTPLITIKAEGRPSEISSLNLILPFFCTWSRSMPKTAPIYGRIRHSYHETTKIIRTVGRRKLFKKSLYFIEK